MQLGSILRPTLIARPSVTSFCLAALLAAFAHAASAEPLSPAEDENGILVVGGATPRMPVAAGAAAMLALVGAGSWVFGRMRRANERAHSAKVEAAKRERVLLEQLETARAAATAADVAKSTFLATIGHEIRTPLNGVIGTADLLLETPLNEQQRGYLTLIRTSADSLVAIVNDLLDFSKLEKGQLVLTHALFELRQSVADVVRIAATQVAERELELVMDVAPDVPAHLHGDAARIRQALLNLVSNAVKFTERGHVAVRVARLPRDTDGNRVWLKFAVSDTGIGVAPELRERIFDRFTQADGSATRKFGGVGLGLTLCKRIVTLMGGEIGLESEPGRGSLFWFSVPLQVEEILSRSPATTAARVLVVDDLAPAANAMKSLLENMHMSAATAESIAEAFERLREADRNRAPFDVMFIDESILQEAGEQGRALLDTPELRAARVVLMVRAADASVDAAPTAPFNARLVKPVLSAAQVMRVLREPRDFAESDRPTPDLVGAIARRRLRLLVAEDNGVNRVVAGGMLKKLGCSVEFANNGAEAVRMTRAQGYDLILMDCLMPEMDGWTATREIRRRDARTPIVALTANATYDDRSRCMQVGMNDYLSKPLRIDDLARVMERWAG